MSLLPPCNDISRIDQSCPNRSCGLVRCPGTPWCFNFNTMVQWDLHSKCYNLVSFCAGIWSHQQERGGKVFYYTPQIKIHRLYQEFLVGREIEKALSDEQSSL